MATRTGAGIGMVARSRLGEFTGGSLAIVLLLIMPFVSYVHYHGYSLFTIEILQIVAMLALAGIGLGILVSVTTGVIQGLLLAVIVTVAIDLCLKDESLTVLLSTFAGACVVITLLKQHIKTLIAVMSLAALSANALVPTSQTLVVEEDVAQESSDSGMQSDLPPVIHLILDEYMGVDALPKVVGDDLRGEIIDLFTSDGFRLAGGAYAQYFNTYNSIGNMLNYSSSNVDAESFVGAEEPYTLASSAYFEQLASTGYRFRIYQSSFLDYCKLPNIEYRSCLTYTAASIKYVEDVSLSAEDKSTFILSDFWRLSMLRQLVRISYNRVRGPSGWFGEMLPFWRDGITTFGPLPAVEVFDQVAKDVAASPGGEVFFAHLLIPHAAYMLDEQCAVRSNFKQWRMRRITDFASNQPNTEESRDLTYEAYVKQLRCTNRLLADFFGKLKATGQFGGATIVVHGDHGSRINLNWPVTSNVERLVESDFTDGFPTLFAVKGPGTKAGFTTDRKTLSALLAETMGVRGSDVTDVFLFDGRSKPMLPFPMPDAWLTPRLSLSDR